MAYLQSTRAKPMIGAHILHNIPPVEMLWTPEGSLALFFCTTLRRVRLPIEPVTLRQWCRHSLSFQRGKVCAPRVSVCFSQAGHPWTCPRGGGDLRSRVG